jgi:mono/diheme cytochrome c family protein
MWKLTLASMGTGIALICATAAAPVKAEDSAGLKLFKQNKCAQCHSIDALKISKVKSDDDEEAVLDENGKKIDPPDLSGVGKDHDAAWFAKWLKKEVEVEGHKHKKKFKGSEDDLKVITEWLASDLKFDVPKKK